MGECRGDGNGVGAPASLPALGRGNGNGEHAKACTTYVGRLLGAPTSSLWAADTLFIINILKDKTARFCSFVFKDYISLLTKQKKSVHAKRKVSKHQQGWGKAAVEQLFAELRAELPGVGGFSASNLSRTKAFFETYSALEKLQPLVGEIAWTHNLGLVQKGSLQEFGHEATRRDRKLHEETGSYTKTQEATHGKRHKPLVCLGVTSCLLVSSPPVPLNH